jgi:apolipoprotein N-acyltransferase
MNILLLHLFNGLKASFSFRANRSRLSWVLGLLLFPVLFSLVRYHTYEEEVNPYECVVLQPNIDPWEKFIEMPQDQQTAYLLGEARRLVTPSTDYVVAPETFINNAVWHHTLDSHPEIEKFYGLIRDFPELKIVVGAMTYKLYEPGDSLSSTAKKMGKTDNYYDSYNSALHLDRTRRIQMYHKSLLVTGAEWMPSFNKYKFIQRLAIDLGGITRSHGTQEERDVFVSPQDGLRVAPVICWESVFGEYVTEYVREKGANLIFIITNDGWWNDTPGHRQHQSYARLRAIETRRSIARSANTGISSLINQRGDVLQKTAYWERDAIKGELNASDHLTFYVKHGDYLARIAAFLSVVFVIYAFVRKRAINDDGGSSGKSRKRRADRKTGRSAGKKVAGERVAAKNGSTKNGSTKRGSGKSGSGKSGSGK